MLPQVQRLISPIDPETIVRRSFMISREWMNWFIAVKAAIDASGQQTGVLVNLDAQGASLSNQVVLNVTVAGLYRVSYYTRITQVATTSSSLDIVLGWTDGGNTCPFIGTTVAGNALTSAGSAVVLIRADAGTPITYSTGYTSVGATPMKYSMTVRAELVP